MENNSQWNPGKIMEVSGAYWKGCALQAAVKLDLFTTLAAGAETAAGLAAKLQADRDGLERLLAALEAMGLVEQEGGMYANTPEAAKWLCRGSNSYMGYMIMHHYQLIQSWCLLDKAVAEGKPQGPHQDFDNPQWRENFLMGMFNIGMQTAPLVAQAMDLAGYSRLLDLGGGPGTYAIFFCRQHPDLTADVFDLPTTEPFARRTIESFGLQERIGFVAGDYNQDKLPGGYDFLWVSHIIHSLGNDGCRRLFSKACQSLEKGGMLAIHDFILDDSGNGPLFASLFSLNMLLRTSSGRSYRQLEIKALLDDAGFIDIRRLDFRGPNDSGIIVARK